MPQFYLPEHFEGTEQIERTLWSLARAAHEIHDWAEKTGQKLPDGLARVAAFEGVDDFEVRHATGQVRDHLNDLASNAQSVASHVRYIVEGVRELVDAVEEARATRDKPPTGGLQVNR